MLLLFVRVDDESFMLTILLLYFGTEMNGENPNADAVSS